MSTKPDERDEGLRNFAYQKFASLTEFIYVFPFFWLQGLASCFLYGFVPGTDMQKKHSNQHLNHYTKDVFTTYNSVDLV